MRARRRDVARILIRSQLQGYQGSLADDCQADVVSTRCADFRSIILVPTGTVAHVQPVRRSCWIEQLKTYRMVRVTPHNAANAAPRRVQTAIGLHGETMIQ